MRTRSLIYLCAALPLALSAQAGQIRYETFTLPNGLRVIYSEDHSTPIVSVDVWYNTGSRNERAGRSGFAHLFEHMMFQGSAHVKKAEHFQYVNRAGGVMNGSTTEDRTNYWETLPSNRLNLALWLEADRMRSLAITDDNFHNQREAVKEERRLRVDNQPYTAAFLDGLTAPFEEGQRVPVSLNFERAGKIEASFEIGSVGAKGPHLGLVGKAVTFDTGGISIKPAGKMHEMKFDMSGGAAVLEAMGAIAELGVPAQVTAVVPATENMPSGRSVKPGDIVTAMNGKTIEVNNTDAEGRLILADGLCYAVDQGAERLVDIATLTGAIVIALGSTYCGLFSNDDDWFGQVDAACSATGELGWRLPLHQEYEEIVKGEYADITNAPEGRKASSIVGGEFLKRFTGDVPWAHVDIAGVAWDRGRAYAEKGGSGFGVRLLVELARGVAAAAE